MAEAADAMDLQGEDSLYPQRTVKTAYSIFAPRPDTGSTSRFQEKATGMATTMSEHATMVFSNPHSEFTPRGFASLH